jgi:hypothetical protein
MSAEPEKMSAEDMLKLVADDSSSDFSEGVGEHGGYVSYSISGNVLSVKAQAYAHSFEENESPALITTERQWKIVPIDAPEPASE